MSSIIQTGDLRNLQEYSIPEFYDLETGGLAENIPVLQELVDAGDSALDLGCGTGRYTIPLAQSDVDMTGIDISVPMLNHAALKTKTLGLSINWIEGDVRDYQLNRRFSLIFDAGEAFVHVLERSGHEAILSRVREHLAENGHFVLLATIMQPSRMVDRLEEHEWFRYTNHADQEVVVSGTERYDHVNQIYHEDAVRRWQDDSGQQVVQHAPLARRYFFPQELDALLHYNGFTVVQHYGDWSGGALTAESQVMIFVCTLRA